MKILIIALPRTGSTTLLKTLAEKHNLTPIMEPQTKEGFREDDDNIVVKCLLRRVPQDDVWFNNLIKKFDEVIILSRKNLKELTESLAYYAYNKDIGFACDSEYYWEMTPNYHEIEESVIQTNEKLINLSKRIGIDITYYEDLYKDSKEGRLRLGNLNKKRLI